MDTSKNWTQKKNLDTISSSLERVDNIYQIIGTAERLAALGMKGCQFRAPVNPSIRWCSVMVRGVSGGVVTLASLSNRDIYILL